MFELFITLPFTLDATEDEFPLTGIEYLGDEEVEEDTWTQLLRAEYKESLVELLRKLKVSGELSDVKFLRNCESITKE